MKPFSMVQVGEQPSPGLLLASSQNSPSSRWPFPQPLPSEAYDEEEAVTVYAQLFKQSARLAYTFEGL
jgi:hypothetical protein